MQSWTCAGCGAVQILVDPAEVDLRARLTALVAELEVGFKDLDRQRMAERLREILRETAAAGGGGPTTAAEEESER